MDIAVLIIIFGLIVVILFWRRWRWLVGRFQGLKVLIIILFHFWLY